MLTPDQVVLLVAHAGVALIERDPDPGAAGAAQHNASAASPPRYNPAAPVPHPMPSDCVIVEGKVGGPENYVYCSRHHHVLDIDAGMVIAHSVEEYNKKFVTTISKKDVKGDDVVAGSLQTGSLELQIATMVNGVGQQAEINAVSFAGEVTAACDDFKAYATKRMEDIKKRQESEAKVGELIGGLAMVVASTVGQMYELECVGEVAKEVAKEFMKFAGEKVKEVAKSYKDSHDIDELPTAADEWASQLRAGGTRMKASAYKLIAFPLTKIHKKRKDGVELSKAEDAFLMHFMDCDGPADYDAKLVGYGIPSFATAKAIHAKVYQELVQRFEEFAIEATTSNEQKMSEGWGITGSPAPIRAKHIAAAEGKKMRELLDDRKAPRPGE